MLQSLPEDIVSMTSFFLSNKDLGFVRGTCSSLKGTGDDWDEREMASRGPRKVEHMFDILHVHMYTNSLECLKDSRQWKREVEEVYEEKEYLSGVDILIERGFKYDIVAKESAGSRTGIVMTMSGYNPSITRLKLSPEDFNDHSIFCKDFRYTPITGVWLSRSLYGGVYKCVSFLKDDPLTSFIVRRSEVVIYHDMLIKSILHFRDLFHIRSGALGWVYFKSVAGPFNIIVVQIVELNHTFILEKNELDRFWKTEKGGDRPVDEAFIPFKSLGHLPFCQKLMFGVSMMISARSLGDRDVNCDVMAEVWT
jgi:hypothetical protein